MKKFTCTFTLGIEDATLTTEELIDEIKIILKENLFDFVVRNVVVEEEK